MACWGAIVGRVSRVGLLLWVALSMAACNLSTEQAVTPTTAASLPTEDTRPTRTPISFGATERPTLLPLINNGGGGSIINTPQPTLLPVTSAPPLGTLCQLYTTYSGADPRNSLSLRASPSVSAPQIFRVPTNQNVFLVPGSGEIEADGYHWLNIIYVQSPQMRYQGWMARDSFSTNGVRDPSIATLRLVNAQAGC